MNAEIPEGWSNAKVEDLAELIRGITYKKEYARNSYEDGYKPILRANNINNTLNFDSLVYVPESLIDRKQYIEKDDIVFAMSSGSKHLVGKSARAIVDFNGSYGAFCGLVRPNINIYPPFLFYSFQDNRFKDFIQRVSKGSNINNLKREHILGYSIFYPPIDEQKNIVAKIEELFSELDSGIASLKTAQQQLKVYRQALLKHAFEGKLTEQWRKDNADKLETPEQLLARIQTERETRYQQQLEEWKQAVKDWEAKGKEGKRPSKPAKLKCTQRVVEQDFKIPNEWALTELSVLAYESVLGKMLDKQKNIGVDQDYLGNINVRWGYFDLNNLKQMKIEETEESRYSLSQGDLVVCEGGEPGRCAIWKGEDGVMFIQKALHRVRFTKSYLSVFAYYYLTYAVPLERVVKHFTGTTIKHLTGTGLGKVQFPICSLAEQQEIVNKLEEKLSIIEQNEKEIESALAKAELLRQSILKKAFSGLLLM